jgi:hypothetical protein
MRTYIRTLRTWLRHGERDFPTGAMFGVFSIVSIMQFIVAGQQDWQPVETALGAVVGLVSVFVGARWVSGYQPSRIVRYKRYCCGTVAVLAATVGDIVTNRRFIKFGDLPGWFAAVGTVGALTVSLSLLTRQVNERRSSQARQASAWIEDLLLDRQPFPVLMVLVKNGSDQAIYGVHVSVLVGVRGTFTRYLESMGPGELREVPIPLPAPPRASGITPDVSFVDGAGNRWLRTGDGRLSNPTSNELLKHMSQDAAAYQDISNHPTLNLHIDDERYRDRRRKL